MKTSVLESPKKICSDVMSLETKSIVLHPSSGDQHSRRKRIDAKRMRFSTKAQSMKYLQQLLRHNEDYIFTGTDRQIVSALFSKYYAINPGQTKLIVTPESIFLIITNLPFLTHWPLTAMRSHTRKSQVDSKRQNFHRISICNKWDLGWRDLVIRRRWVPFDWQCKTKSVHGKGIIRGPDCVRTVTTPRSHRIERRITRNLNSRTSSMNS